VPDAVQSLRRGLLAALLLPLLVILALGATASYAVALHYANEVYDGWLYDSVSSLAQALDTSPTRTTLNLHGSAQDLFEWDVLDQTFFKVSSSRAGLIAGRADLPPPPPGATPFRRARLFDGTVDGIPVRAVTLQVQGAPGEQVVLEVAETEQKRGQLAAQMLLSALVPQVLLIGAVIAIISFGIRRGLAPLDALAARITGQSARSIEPIEAEAVPEEVRPLTTALNELLSRLGAVMATQRKFVADAAHQLRTPLAALKLHLDQDLDKASPEALRETLARLRVSTDRAARLSHQLLSLARAEPEAVTGPAERVDLCALAQDVGAQWVPQALRKSLDLGFAGTPGPVEVHGDPVLLREAINNLLDNAVKYHPGGGRITLSVHGGAQPAIAVEDDGPGIPASEHEQVVQRFYRGDRKGTEGSGLGLAIVKEIASLHQGQLRLQEGANERGLRVVLSFPPAAPATAAA
jgi:two-component system sensor histidine kinase TctE